MIFDSRRLVAGTFILIAVITASPASATRIVLRADVGTAKAVDVTVKAEDHVLCILQKAEATCEFDLPAASAWTVSAKRPLNAERTVAVLDIGSSLRKLEPSAAPYGERFAEFLRDTDRFVRKHLPDQQYPALEAGTPATLAATEVAAKRLGFALPADFVSLQRALGSLEMGDNRLMPITELDDAYTQMRQTWGTPEEAMQEDYSDAFRAVLKQSTLLFTEVGDGYGGLLYRPGATKACGEKGAYYWTAQEGGTQVLKQDDGQCMDFATSMRWIVNRFVLDELAETIGESEHPRVLLDSSLPVQQVVLRVHDGSGIALRGEWPGAH